MLTRLKTLVGTFRNFGVESGTTAQDIAANERSAVATLLVHAATADGHLDKRETAVLGKLLQQHYRLGAIETQDLLDEAHRREAESVEIYGIIRAIKTSVPAQNRRAIIRLMWTVAVADGDINEFESNLIWRTAELIGVSTRERVSLRQDVLAEQAAAAAAND